MLKFLSQMTITLENLIKYYAQNLRKLQQLIKFKNSCVPVALLDVLYSCKYTTVISTYVKCKFMVFRSFIVLSETALLRCSYVKMWKHAADL